jgi:hypothetical protein
MSPSTLLDLEEVPFAILEAVKARILASRRNIGKPPPSTRPRPQFRKFGASTKGWRKPQYAAGVLGGDGWLLVPSGPFIEELGGYSMVTEAGTRVLAKSGEFSAIYKTNNLGPYLLADPLSPGPFQASFESAVFTESDFQSFTFELIAGNPDLPATTVTGNGAELFVGFSVFNASTFETTEQIGLFLLAQALDEDNNLVDNPNRIIEYIGEGQPLSVVNTGVVYEPVTSQQSQRHFAVVKNANDVNLYVNGNLVATGSTNAIRPATGGTNLSIQARNQGFKGIRFTPGQALYSGNSFAPPTSITDLE